ncbi:beta/gamma crystallin-related protein [Massilia sp. GER05]|uniref:beta/gamma crystallin-related protein n=1 Tax=Massilia sp. GER05 TaxID=3394605 RepID=UPI003F8629CC
MKRLLAAAAVLATFTHAAFAGELTLFSDSNFRGQRVTIDRDAASLGDVNFNDRASSAVIRSGTWLLCEHANFGGRCQEFGPGEYRELPGFNDAISSARQLDRGGRGGSRGDDRGDRGDRGGWRGDRGGPDVVMFAGQRFEGQQVELSQDVRALSDVGFNDRATSLIIREGRWEFCEHADFRGECVVLGPGRYDVLDRMNNRISSMRRVR